MEARFVLLKENKHYLKCVAFTRNKICFRVQAPFFFTSLSSKRSRTLNILFLRIKRSTMHRLLVDDVIMWPLQGANVVGYRTESLRGVLFWRAWVPTVMSVVQVLFRASSITVSNKQHRVTRKIREILVRVTQLFESPCFFMKKIKEALCRSS